MFERYSNVVIYFYAGFISFVIYKINIYLALDFDTAMQITKMYHNEIFDLYPHHQWIVFYYSIFFKIFYFIDNDYNRLIFIFLFHYSSALVVLWRILRLLNQNRIINMIYFISISISGTFLFLILSQEDSIITLPYYFLAFYFFLLFYEKRKIRYISLSGFLSGFSTTINSSDFFLTFGILVFFILIILTKLFKKEKDYDFFLKGFLFYSFSFLMVLSFLLLIKAIILKNSFFVILQQTFSSPHSQYRELLGEFGITLERVIKTINVFSFILFQNPKFWTQFHYHILAVDIFILFMVFYSLWSIRSYKPVYAVLGTLLINLYIIITSNEIALNERLISSFFIFLIILKSKKKWFLLIYTLLFVSSSFNLKNFYLYNETYDKFKEIAKKEKIYISVYYFYSPKVIEKYIQKKLNQKQLLESSSGIILGLGNLILKNECFIYNPYPIQIPYLPKNCKVFHDLQKIYNYNTKEQFTDPYLIELKNQILWSCQELQNYLMECNQTFKNFIPNQRDFFSEKVKERACSLYDVDCSQKIQIFCNYLFYCFHSLK
ncbi:MAG: hypothetical protein ACK4UJ_08255 [Leptonema sp. (in: bacteria)]